ncbi:MAG: hypothetical protein HZB13_08670 [Acidobacteria bacterium]|nr:hypothetical protein [Acidobacteriota bacterium]
MRLRRFAILFTCALPALAIDLSKAVVLTPPALTAVEKKAAQVIVEEVEKRSRLRWTIAESPAIGVPSITLRRTAARGPAEGYSIVTRGSAVEIAGNDERGTLFGAGRLLRELRMDRDTVSLPDGFTVTSAPKYPLRGHQLGYRPKTNSYDGWTAAMWDTYIRELAIFGANAIELIPPRSDDAADSPHFPAPQMQMMTEMSRITASYGLDVWIWYPALDKDYTDPSAVQKAVDEWAEVFKRLPRIDAVMVPGGDPGHTQPKVLMALLEKQTASLKRFHPKAGMWVSPQGFSQEWMDEFYALLKQQPAWLTGIVHGPEVRVSIQELRRNVPARYPIRNYPDITHSLHCQFGVPDWDVAHSQTHAREPINPRPMDMRAIMRRDSPSTIGFLTYSEGCNDDVNKAVWSALGWDPDADVTNVLREFARFFIGPRFEEGVAQGLLALERNWRGSLAANSEVETVLEQFQSMERSAPPPVLLNWRFQQALYRAYYDALNRRRLLQETAAEQRAMDALGDARRTGALAAMARAEAQLAPTATADPLRLRVFQLAEGLFQSARMQLSVPLYQAISRDRGATLDNIDAPLNNRGWLQARFAAIRAMEIERERLQAIDVILNWTNPGPGGFYDDLGHPGAQPHLVRPVTYEDDPGHLRTPRNGFARHSQPVGDLRISWLDHAEVMYDGPLEMRYAGLDPAAQYRVRIVYGGERNATRIMKLTANGQYEVHPFRKLENLFEPLEFDIPRAATSGGVLQLKWERTPGMPGNGRGTQVAEVWLMRGAVSGPVRGTP